jgi:DNA mismatch endonuclease (patch repair protein)
VDTISEERRSENMRRIRSHDTSPELIVRRLMRRFTWHVGVRYRLNWSKLPGKPDIAVTTQRKAVFIHGCFWHQHTKCRHGRLPKSRLEYWEPKLARNQSRDRTVKRSLSKLGWRILTIWECDVDDLERLEKRLKKFAALPPKRSSLKSRTVSSTVRQSQSLGRSGLIKGGRKRK